MRKAQLKFGPEVELYSKGIRWHTAAQLPGERGRDSVLQFSTQLYSNDRFLTLTVTLVIFLKLSKWQLIINELSRQENVSKDVFTDPSLPLSHFSHPQTLLYILQAFLLLYIFDLDLTVISNLRKESGLSHWFPSMNVKQIITSPTTTMNIGTKCLLCARNYAKCIVSSISLNLTITTWGKYYYDLQFTAKEIESGRSKVIYSRTVGNETGIKYNSANVTSNSCSKLLF